MVVSVSRMRLAVDLIRPFCIIRIRGAWRLDVPRHLLKFLPWAAVHTRKCGIRMAIKGCERYQQEQELENQFAYGKKATGILSTPD